MLSFPRSLKQPSCSFVSLLVLKKTNCVFLHKKLSTKPGKNHDGSKQLIYKDYLAKKEHPFK